MMPKPKKPLKDPNAKSVISVGVSQDLFRFISNGGTELVEIEGGASENEPTSIAPQQAIEEGAGALDMPYVTGRWIGGTITNFSEIKNL